LHGGTIEAYSEGPGLGSRFTLVVPASDARASVERAAEAAPPGSPRRILVVDDNADILETTQTLLSLWGHQVSTALNGREALEVFSRAAPDIAFIDIGLPGMDGYELAASIRRLPEEREHRARLVAMTGYGQPADRARALEAGFDAYLLKPVSADALIALIADAGAAPHSAAP
jgi:CheY-like chemotaxis protein